MIEAVGKKYLPIYLDTIKKCLESDGHAIIQGITIADDKFDEYSNQVDFIQKYIFPGGFLPSLGFMKTIMHKNNLNLTAVHSYADHYAQTLATWRSNFLTSWQQIAPLGFNDAFKKIWEFYLSYCEAGFKSKNIDLIQFSMSNK